MLNVNYEKNNEVMVVRLSGELMVNSVSKLKDEFNEYQSNSKYFLFDFKNISMIDSSGLGYIVYCLKKLREKEGDLKIVNLENQAKLIFEITRVNSIVDIYTEEEEALKEFDILENGHESDNSHREEIIA